ncbi:MAG: cytochrome c oxidase assembly protein [Anaerolineae bacterium]|jgi:cytochrome c oxidase assembly factor CtaG
MSPFIRDWLFEWQFWPQIILSLLGLAFIYGLGWWRLRQKGAYRLANGWRLASFLGGLAALWLAMISFIEVLQEFLFSVHMVQHILIAMVGPPLLLLADPLPFLLWGLPLNARRAVGLFLARKSPYRRYLKRLSAPWLVWGLYVLAQWGWHTPAAYDAALRHEVFHILEHTSYFVTAMLFWWHVSGSAPRLHGRLSYGLRMGYLLSALVPNEILGVVISLAGQPIYTHYTSVPRVSSLSVMDDQMLGGALMWVPGGMMYALGAVVLLARMLEQEERAAQKAALDARVEK